MLSVCGMGLVNADGRGWDRQGCAEVGAPSENDSSLRVCRVRPESLEDPVALKKLRRADRFSKFAALSAWDAVADAGLSAADLATGTGIIVTTAWGPHGATFDFLDEILDFGDGGVSPTRFSHSVHNAAAAYVAILFGSRGPTCTLADFERPLRGGLSLASLWLREDRCRRILVTYTEESSGPMEYIAAMRRAPGAGGFVQPFNLSSDPSAVLSEGSVCLVLARPEEGRGVLDLARFDGDHPIRDVFALREHLAGLRRPVGDKT